MAENSEVGCKLNEDCSSTIGGPSLCYIIDPDNSSLNICDCSIYSGWVGENCNDPSPVLYYNRFATIILSVWCIIVLFLLLRTMCLTIVADMGVRFDTLFATGVFASASTICILTYEVYRIPGLFDPTFFEIIEFHHLANDNQSEIEHKNGDIILYFKIFGMVLIGFSQIAMLLSWEDITNKILTMKSLKEKHETERRICALYTFSAIYSIYIIIFISLRAVRLVFFSVASVNVLISLTFIYVSGKLYRSLKTISTNTPGVICDVTKYIKLIRACTVIALICVSASNFTFLILREHPYKLTKPGDFHLIHFIRDIATSSGMLLFTIIAWYINSVSSGPIIAEFYPKCCYLFKRWDARNAVLIPETATSSGEVLRSGVMTRTTDML